MVFILLLYASHLKYKESSLKNLIFIIHAIKLINDTFYISDYVVVHLIAALRTSSSPRFDSLKESIFNEKNVGLFISRINDDFNAGMREPLLQEIIKDAEKVLRSA